LRLEVDFGDALVIAGGQPVEDLRQPLPRTPVDPPHDAEIDGNDGAVVLHEQVALVHVGMEEAGADRLGQEADDQLLRDRREVMPARAQFIDAAYLDPVDPFDGHHPAIGAIPVDIRDAVAGDARHLLGKFARRGGLASQIEFGICPALEIGDGETRAQAARFTAHCFDMGSRPFIGRDVAREFLADAGAQHLDRDLAAIGGDALVHLRDARRADWHRINLGEQVFDRLAEARFDSRLDLREWHRRQRILQGQQIIRRFLAHQIRTSREALPQLDRRRANRAERPGIVAGAALSGQRGEPCKAHQLAQRGGRVGIILDPHQRAPPGERHAPARKAGKVRYRARHVTRSSTPNGSPRGHP